MIIPEGLMHKKVNLLIALLVIIVIAISAAFAIAAQAALLNFGGKITSYVPGCTQAVAIPNVCGGTPCPCGVCGCIAAPCVPPPPRWSEILFTPSGGNTNYICPQVNFRYKGALPAVGKFILGNAKSPYQPTQIGISR